MLIAGYGERGRHSRRACPVRTCDRRGRGRRGDRAAILGVGEGTNSKVYLVDTPDGGAEDRVFVSNGNTLYRQHVAGSGSSGAGLNAEYALTFEDPSDYWQQSCRRLGRPVAARSSE
jgi:hypothetical protein